MQQANKNKIVAYWLLTGVLMLVVQVLLGGITRLTGSGLSITEWKPILGALPPMNNTDWESAFQLYQQKTGQFKYLNQDFTMADFKFIYFWEWFHRNWARLISVVFLLPFIYFLVKKYFSPAMISKLIALFLLGAAQGLIGWIMVKSGLNDDNLYVSHIRLALHFISALVLIGFTFWFAISLLITDDDIIVAPGIKNFTIVIIGLLMLQLTYGAFMAGLKAATVAPTWPDINGDVFPVSLLNESWINHKINIHFVHRMLAYVLFVLIFIWYSKANKLQLSGAFNKVKWIPPVLTIAQVLLGIFTVLSSTQLAKNSFGLFEYLAQAHQLFAMFLLLSLLLQWYLLRGKPKARSR